MRSVARRGQDRYRLRRWAVVYAVLLASMAAIGLQSPTTANAASGSPWWHLSTRMFPSNLPVGGEATVALTAINLGDGQARGVPKVVESFPEGYSVQNVELFVLPDDIGKQDLANLLEKGFEGPPFCEHTVALAQCKVTLTTLASFNREEAVLNPYEDIEMRVTVKNESGSPSGAQMSGEITGGEAPTVRIAQDLPSSAASPAFGVEHVSMVPEDVGGGVDVRAGSHPFQFTSTLTLNESADQKKPIALPRDLNIKLPPGLVGNASKLPQCTEEDLKSPGEAEGGVGLAATVNKCPPGSMIGAAVLTFDEPNLGGVVTNAVPVFNLVPERGEPARFGFEVVQAPVILDTSVRTGSDYGVTVTTRNITELAAFISSVVTFWGVPGDERHDNSRGWPCFTTGKWYSVGAGEEPPPCVLARQSRPPALLSLPTACEPFKVSVDGSSWPTAAAPGGLQLPRAEYALADEFGRELGISGCGSLRFEPSIDVTPDLTSPSSPTGLRVDLHMPQEADEIPSGTANATIKDLSVSLPEGVVVNPASATGLEACSESAVGYLANQSSPPSSLGFTPSLPQGWEAGAGFCPSASKIGTVDIASRLLPPGQTVKGAVYLAAQNANPFGSLLAMYIVAEDAVSGVAVKLAGEVSPDPATGRLTTTFHNMPQLPFEDATLRFFGGPRAPLATPATCGAYTTVASATPWSENTRAAPTSTFTIGTPCPTQRPFAPQLTAVPQSIQAGAFTNLSTAVTLGDGSQPLQAVTVRTPPGFSGVLTGIKRCGEEQANAGSCDMESLIGHATALVGVGPEPFEVTGGQVYLTKGYDGAPFGLSIVAPAKAGPFDLGTVVVRARLDVDRHTAQVTITTDATGPHAIPHILDGIPLSIKQVKVTIDRNGFTFNPTSCAPMAVTGSVSSDEGSTAAVSSPFQVANCATLPFRPTFEASTAGKASKADGASLRVRVASGPGQANIARTDLTLPVALPSRLTTIQKACAAAVFEANPSSCPDGSNIGTATVHTPVLASPLSGPAYLVSYGSAKFPDVEFVLQGEGITLVLDGQTDIKKGITYSRFETVPDAPISSFEAVLPTGPHSALAANVPASAKYSLCGTKLKMPTAITGQNGAIVKQQTKITVTGCRKAKTATRAQKLAAALKACHKKRGKAKRAACAHQARKKYGPPKKAKRR
jgi:hypothetical protein